MNLNTIRERFEAREEELSPFAVRSTRSRGRKLPEPPSPVRTEFQRDRDRIIHTNSFRRLKHKSQVFVAPLGDHYVTRLTHVIEVQQIGRTIARALNLNEDLVEAASLGHDLGHTPFGHIGESVLNRLLPGGFHHSRHSVRIVELLEGEGRGLNLTEEVVEAIRHHSKPQGEFLNEGAVSHLTLEAQVVRLSDALAYLTHDIGDAIRSGFLKPSSLPPEVAETLGTDHGRRVNTLVCDVVQASWDCSGEVPVRGGKPWVRMSDPVGRVTTTLRNFMFENFYLPISEGREGRRAADIVELLFHHYLRHPEGMPQKFTDMAGSKEQAAADWVCGMTDNFALMRAEEIQPGISEGVFHGHI
ncbi:MAG: deoxyguanosinetriphosphate triphosphohydrolase [Dehalococcoidia bacterium]|nr:deoxyguanosinetriphosphate triphosphohydrolase [Dehalococcoidia bacterium]